MELGLDAPGSCASRIEADSTGQVQHGNRDWASTGAGFDLFSALVASFCP